MIEPYFTLFSLLRNSSFNFPLGAFGPPSTLVALAGECVYKQNNDAFWDFKTLLMRSQRQIDYTTQNLAKFVTKSINTIKYKKLVTCIERERFIGRVNSDRAIGEKSGVVSTPTVFVNGERVEDASGNSDPSFSSITSAIEQAFSTLEVDGQ